MDKGCVYKLKGINTSGISIKGKIDLKRSSSLKLEILLSKLKAILSNFTEILFFSIFKNI